MKTQNKKHSFFEGWYFKHQSEHTSLALIPAYHIDLNRKISTSLQVVTPKQSYWIPFSTPPRIAKSRFDILLGHNRFSESGIQLNVKTSDFYLKGVLRYGPFLPLVSDIMGPFRFWSRMQCNHGVLSLTHRLSGTLDINGKMVDFTDGTGYIEKDWGHSFPQSYLWTQCNFTETDTGQAGCIMVSIASIPMFGTAFTGCIGVIYYLGQEYRLATYHHVHILRWTNQEVILSQRELLLRIRLLKNRPVPLKAPQAGSMVRTVHESLSASVHYQFFIGGTPIFDIVSHRAGFETSGL